MDSRQEPAVKTAGLRAPGLATQVLTSLSQGKKPSGYVTGGYSPRGASLAPGSEGRSTPAGEGSHTGADTPPVDIGEGTLSGESKHRMGGAGLSPAYSPREAEKERGGERANSSHRQDGVSPSHMFYEPPLPPQ